MIDKITKGRDTRGLLYYLYGPGKSDEHTDPHLVAGWRGDLPWLEPPRKTNGQRDFRRLAGLLDTPLKMTGRQGTPGTVWHCVLSAAPADPLMSDEQWQQIATEFMDRMGLAQTNDPAGVRWVAVRHGLSKGSIDHIHIVATLARQDGAIPSVHNDFTRARRACREIERRHGLTVTAPADRTAAVRPSRSEKERAARTRRREPPRITLRRLVQDAAATALTEEDFFAVIRDAGALVRLRYSDRNAGEVTGYAVALTGDTAKNGQPVWYGGGKLAPDLTMPKLRRRWRQPATIPAISAESARAFLRSAACSAAEHARNETDYFAALERSGVLMRYYRSDEDDPGRITGYAVSLPGQHWVSGGKLSDNLTIGRLRQRWTAPEGSIRPPVTAAERRALWEDVVAAAGQGAGRLRDQIGTDPGGAADAAWATADLLRAAARAVRGPAGRELRRAAGDFDRAAREAYVVVPRQTRGGDTLRVMARFVAVAGHGAAARQVALLVRMLADLAEATAELREASQRAHQAAAARRTAERLYRLNQRLSAGPAYLENRPAGPSPTSVAARPSSTPAPSHQHGTKHHKS